MGLGLTSSKSLLSTGSCTAVIHRRPAWALRVALLPLISRN